MSNKIIKPLIILGFSAFAVIIILNACSKSGSSYGSSGGAGTGSSVSIKGFAFSVSSLSVKTGTKVTWTNNDAVTHTVTADDGSFNSGNIAPGSAYSKTFITAGTFPYHCSIHTSMTATVTVQ